MLDKLQLEDMLVSSEGNFLIKYKPYEVSFPLTLCCLLCLALFLHKIKIKQFLFFFWDF